MDGKEREVPSNPNSNFPSFNPVLPLKALIKFFMPINSTISGESPFICSCQFSKNPMLKIEYLNVIKAKLISMRQYKRPDPTSGSKNLMPCIRKEH